MSAHKPLFRSAVTDENGDVDAGYLGLYVVMLMCLGTIPSALLLVAIRMIITEKHELDLIGLAAVIAAAGACFGTAATGVGIFRWGDKPRQPAPGVTTTTAVQTTTSTTPVVPAAEIPRD